MKISFKKSGTTLIVIFIGELDHHSSTHIKNKIDTRLLNQGINNIIFDFSKVEFMDSSGIGIIINRYKQIKSLNGKFALTCVGSQIKKVLEMSSIPQIVPIYNTNKEALGSFDKAYN